MLFLDADKFTCKCQLLKMTFRWNNNIFKAFSKDATEWDKVIFFSKNEITMEVGEWVQVSLGKEGKLKNCFKARSYASTDIFREYTMLILCVCTLLKVYVHISDDRVSKKNWIGVCGFSFGLCKATSQPLVMASI